MHCTDMLALLSRRYNMELFETRIVHSRFIESRIPLELAAAAATAIQIIFFSCSFSSLHKYHSYMSDWKLQSASISWRWEWQKGMMNKKYDQIAQLTTA